MDILGVDIGGSHIAAAKVDLHQLKIDESTRVRKKVDSLGSKTSILDAWLEALSAFPLREGFKLGIAMPAPFDYENGIALLKDQGKFRSLYRFNIKSFLSKELGLDAGNIYFFNDAASFLQGEAVFQQLPDEARVIGLTLGTGLGSAYKFGKKAQDAELWSSSFKGRHAEYFLGTEWFVRWAKEEVGLDIPGPKELLKKDEEAGKKAMAEFGENLGEFLAMHVSKAEASHIVIGGNIANAKVYFVGNLDRKLKDAGHNVSLTFSLLGEDAALLGAASNCV